MIIKDIPQSGKLGLTVTWPGRNGLIRRTLVTPANPQTPAQLAIRDHLAREARRYDALTEAQQDAWVVAAESYQSRPRLGQSGPLTGLQLFTKVNCNLTLLGQDPVDVPPVNPQFEELAPQNLVIANAAGVITLKLTCPSDPGDSTVVRGSKPLNSGARACSNYRVLGVCPAPAQGVANITAIYTAKYGVPPVGKRIFVQCTQMIDGFESLPRIITHE